MKTWIDGKQKHFLIGALLLIYLLSANRLYVLYFLKNGKPDSTNTLLPAPTTGITYKLADMQPVRVNGQNLYQIRGYAFESANPLKPETIRVILSSRTQNLAFPTQPVTYPNMIESYSGYQQGMGGAEFIMLLSDQVLDPGTYQVGILLQDSSGNQAYVKTGSVIHKTPNTIQYTGEQ